MIFGPRNDQSLSVRRSPMVGESIKSFVWRLAEVNACSYGDILAFLGFNRQSKPWFLPGSRSEQDMYSSLGKALNVSESALLDVLRTPELKALWTPSVKGTSDMKVRAIRMCSSCVEETRYHRQAWQHALYCVCPLHQEKLIETCPHCGEAIVIETCVGGRCFHCASAVEGWSRHQMAMPDWQSQVNQGAASLTTLKRLLNMAMIVIRSDDLFTTDMRIREMRITETMALMDKAWGLLHSDTARQQLRDKLSCRWRKEIAIIGEALPLTLYDQADALALTAEQVTPLFDMDKNVFSDRARALEIIKSSKHAAMQCENVETHELIKASPLSKGLGIKPGDLERLKLSGFFTQVNPTAAKRDALFNLKDVVAKFMNVPVVNRITDGYERYDGLVPKACLFTAGLYESDVLLAMSEGVLPVQIASEVKGTFIDRLFVHKATFQRLYAQEYKQHNIGLMPIGLLPTYLGTKRLNVTAFLASDFFKGIAGHDAPKINEQIPTCVLKRVEDRYFILNKWAFFNGRSKTKCLCALKLAKIDPILRLNEEGCGLFEIYPKHAETILLERFDELSPNYKGKKRRRTK
ncbi:TniQ family protein [Photobacterium sanguinicancri]|uniref:TniQ family protein n=1 Tax=Photobacterium sanguinicancri TaxID=875932 RepID=UPI002480CE61|nr:TniQ family protein [Photobacterium sanguinicancri]